METPSKLALWTASLAAALLIGFTAFLLPGFAFSTPDRAREASVGVVPVAATPGCDEDGKPACDALVEMEVRDVVPLEAVSTHAVVLVAKETGTVLPIFVDESSAVAIAFRLADRKSPHPLAQDLLDTVVEKLGGKVTEVRIDDVREDVFHGRIFISQGEKNLQLDARPSDSISMALTRGAKIFATQRVLLQAGITREEIDELRQMPGVGGSGEEGLGDPLAPNPFEDEVPVIPPTQGEEIRL